MGPRSIDRGNQPIASGEWEDHLLQWGRDRSIAEIPPNESRGQMLYQLQWGRDRSIAEMGQSVERAAPRRAASMGPRSIDRGNSARRPGDTCAWPRRFNGAAIDRSRKYARPDMGGPRVRASMGPRSIDRGNLRHTTTAITRRCACFNGAAIDRSRKYGEGLGGPRAAPCASMGPRSIDRGNIMDPRRKTSVACA